MSASVLVGRQRELSVLVEALRVAGEQDQTTILLTGEPGVGKTRLLAEARRAAASMGFRTLKGACFEFDSMHPLAPISDLLRSEFREVREDAQAPGSVRLSPGLARLVPELRNGEDEVDAKQERHELFDAVVSFLMSAEEQVPLFLVLEDLHWADDESLDLLVFLARRLRRKRVLLAATYRTGDVPPRLQAAIETLNHSQLATSIELSPLSESETADMIRHMRNGRPVRPDVALTLHELTDGNPLFLEEVIGSLGSTAEALHDDRGQSHLPLAVLQPPASVREAVRRRASLLTEEATRVLEVAAVAGRRFDFDLLVALTDVTEEALIATLRELVAAQLVVEESPDRFTFRHALTQQAVYTGLLTRERRRVHERVARFLRDSPVQANPGQLAHHFFESQSWPEAARYSEAAGEHALALFSPRAATKHFTRALEATGNAGEEPNWRTVWLRARAFDTLGDLAAAKDDYERAAARAEQSGDKVSAWQALLDLGLLWAASSYEEARKCFDRCLELAKELANEDVVARTLNRAANSSVNAYRELDKALAMHEEALGLAQAMGNPQLIAECRDLLGMASFQTADLRAADGHYTRAIAAFRALDDRYGLSSSLAMRALSGGGVFTETEVPSGRSRDDRLHDANEALKLAVESDWAPGEAFARCVLAWIAVPVGQYQLALDSACRALSLAEDIGHRQWTVAALCALGNVHAAVLDLDEASQLLERGRLLARDLSSPLWVCNLGSSLVELEVARGRLDAATEVMREIEAYGVDERALHARGVRAARARLALAVGDAASSLRLCEDLLSKAASGKSSAVPRLLMLKGEALAALGRHDQARGVLEAAAETSRGQGNRNLLWRACVALERTPGASRNARNRGAVEEARTIVAELAESIGDPEARQRFTRAAESRFPAAPRATPRQAAKMAFGGLTEREREVAALVAQGLTNAAIAARLVVGDRTIEVHVSHILEKLQLSTRAQIAAWTVTSGLMGGDEIRDGESKNLSVPRPKDT